MPQLNRNHYFAIGVVLLLLGIQLRMVDTFVLNEKASEIVAKNIKKEPAMSSFAPSSLFGLSPQREQVNPPQWLGYALLSIGGVLTLFALVLPKPAG